MHRVLIFGQAQVFGIGLLLSFSCQGILKEDLHVEVEEHALGVKEWIGTVISNHNVATFIKASI